MAIHKFRKREICFVVLLSLTSLFGLIVLITGLAIRDSTLVQKLKDGELIKGTEIDDDIGDVLATVLELIYTITLAAFFIIFIPNFCSGVALLSPWKTARVTLISFYECLGCLVSFLYVVFVNRGTRSPQ